MRNFKSTLLAATVCVVAVASPVQAQVALSAPADDANGALRGAGASSVQNVVVRNFNCIGPDKQLAKSSSTTNLSDVSAGLYAGGGTAATPALDCSSENNNIQPNIAGKYVSTGSGFGRTMWKEFADDFDGGSGPSATTGVHNPFGQTSQTRWPHLQFAYSDAGLSQAELTSYNTNAAPSAGAAISFPLFVLPVAIAYSPIYGTNAAGRSMVFNAQGKGISSQAALQLSKSDYCGIFNGAIKNWNHPDLKASNKGKALFDPVNDTAARWTASGVPIRLVGRLDKSGTTDVFTRHLAAVCNNVTNNGVALTNKYLRNAETLPYSAVGSVNADFTGVRSDSNYFPTVASSKLAGTTNMISGDYWTGSQIVNLGGGTPTSMPTSNVGSGLYLIADGGGKVASAIVSAPDYTLGAVTLNGKIGYISADFVSPSPDAPGGLNAASLQIGGTGTTYAAPSPKNALAAFTQLPPETNSSGAYTAGTDTRQVTQLTGPKANATRANPLAWFEVLYADANPLSAPSAGYPIVGATQFFGYTCYTSTNRQAIGNHLGLILGQIAKNSANTAVSKAAFGGLTANPGIIVQGNIAVVPTTWATAITKTFLSNADATGLHIQSMVTSVPAKGTPGARGYVAQNDPTANSSCSGKTGA